MKKSTILALKLLMVCGFYSGTEAAYARVGFYFGVPFYPYPYYGYPYPYPYYPPAVVTVPPVSQNYIIQAPSAMQQNPVAAYWYYCKHPKGYYPYVRECPGGWQRVAPTPQH